MPYDKSKYEMILKLCQLDKDLKHSFPAGDLTELGEQGLNLSGG
jgi:ABC-type multidrug transport system fused ATPase/permease subunit